MGDADEDDQITEDQMAMLSAISLDDVIEEGLEEEELDEDEEVRTGKTAAVTSGR